MTSLEGYAIFDPLALPKEASLTQEAGKMNY